MRKKEDTRSEKTWRWLEKNRARIQGKVLCTGLDPETADHLATLLPDASIVCLSGGQGGAPRAGGAAGASLHAPLWLPGDPAGFSGGLFDTVIAAVGITGVPAGGAGSRAGSPDSTGSCPENSGSHGDDALPAWPRGTFYLRRASLLMEHYEPQAHALCRHLRPGGTLLCLAGTQHDEYLLGWCLSLAAEGMAVDPASIREIRCLEEGRRTVLQGIAASAGARTDLSTLIAENLNHALDRMNTSRAEYDGRGAEILLQADAGELVRGCHIYLGDVHMGKLAVYTSVRNPEAIYYFTDVAGDVPYLKRFPARERETVVRHLRGELQLQRTRSRDVHWKELELHEDWSETEME